MKSTIGLGLVLAVALFSTAGSARQGQPRPQPSPNGPLEVIVKGDVSLKPGTTVEVSPGAHWPMTGNASSVFVVGAAPVQWSYDYVCLAGGTPDRWTDLAKHGQDGWELVGSAGASCTQGNLPGTWFILKKPGTATK